MPPPDWDQTYRDPQAPPWDTGYPCTQLRELVQSGAVTPCRAIDLGCGTGTNVIYLAQQGFAAAGLDLSPVAIEKARQKADAAKVKAHFVCGSALALPDLGAPFDFVFDRGCFHMMEPGQRGTFIEQVLRITSPGTVFFLLCGNSKEPLNPGPPTMTEDEIRASFSRDFAIEKLWEFRFDTVNLPKAPLGHAALMRRK
jgi:SAM-dependent methyltransferase